MSKYKLEKSLIGRRPNQVATAHSLGLFHIGDIREIAESQITKIKTINHLISEVKEK